MTHPARLILGAGRNPGHYTTQPRPIDVTIDKAKSAGADPRLNLTRQQIPYGDGHFGGVPLVLRALGFHEKTHMPMNSCSSRFPRVFRARNGSGTPPAFWRSP